MGSLPAITNWTPKDDLLLKNAVEAGASLEALAKGAVCFSRRFTIKELQDRWHALLYDLNTSTEASSRIFEIDVELTASNALKAARNCSLKGKENSTEKRKESSIHNHYYALRKRVCSEPRVFSDVVYPSLLGALVMDKNVCGNQISTPSNPSDDYDLPFEIRCPVVPLLGHFEQMEEGHDTGQHILSDRTRLYCSDTGAGGTGSYPTEHEEAELANCMLKGDDLLGYSGNTISSVDKARGINDDQVLHGFVQEEVSYVPRENPVPLGAHSKVESSEIPQEAIFTNISQDVNQKAKFVSIFDSAEGSHNGVVGGQNISSMPVEYGKFGDSCNPPDLHVWRQFDQSYTPTIPVEQEIDANEHRMCTSVDLSHCDYVRPEARLVDNMHVDSAIHQDVDFLNFHTDFSDADGLFACGSGHDDWGALVVSSPGGNELDVPSTSSLRGKKVLDTCGSDPKSSFHLENEKAHLKETPVNQDQLGVSCIGITSDSSNISLTTEPSHGFMFCAFNTEDREIPCNDDVVLRVHPSLSVHLSDLGHFTAQTEGLVCSSREIVNDVKTTVGGLSVAKEESVEEAQPPFSSLTAPSELSPEVHLKQSSDRFSMNDGLQGKDTIVGVSRNAVHSICEQKLPTPVASTLQSSLVCIRNNEVVAMNLGKQDQTCYSLQVEGPNNDKLSSNDNVNIRKWETDSQIICQQYVALPITQESVTTVPKSNHDKLAFESEDDVPSFSEIEEMILDMDLSPYDQESHVLTSEASRSQCTDTKKVVMRLELGAYSYLQRAMKSRGAFAVFYGLHLKYYMKKPKILLGRATEDVNVDIDLGREGRANKISRRQAIIKIDDDGSFCLKNVGKCSIFVNNKEVLAKKRINLTSGCLIEIRSMRFIFEIDDNAIELYNLFAKGQPT